MTFSPDGQVLVASRFADEEVVIDSWEAKTGRELKRIPKAAAGIINALAFSPDGTLLASSGVEGRIYVWDFASRTLKFHLEGHAEVASVVFSADGTQLFSCGDEDTIRRWDVSSRSGTGLWRLPQGGEVRMALAPDEESIVSARGNEIRIGDADPRAEATSIKVLRGWTWPIVSPDGKYVIVADPDDLTGSHGAAVWDIASGQHKFDLFSEGMLLKCFAFSPDGRLLAASSLWKDGLVGIWDMAAWEKGGSRMRPFKCLTNGFEPACVSFSPDGKILASAGFPLLRLRPKNPAVQRIASRSGRSAPGRN
jgi:WD40 repeat protein